MTIKLLVAGMSESGIESLIDQYGAIPGQIEDSNFAIKELNIQENGKVIKIQFFEPLEKDLEKFSSLYETSLKENKFDG